MNILDEQNYRWRKDIQRRHLLTVYTVIRDTVAQIVFLEGDTKKWLIQVNNIVEGNNSILSNIPLGEFEDYEISSMIITIKTVHANFCHVLKKAVNSSEYKYGSSFLEITKIRLRAFAVATSRMRNSVEKGNALPDWREILEGVDAEIRALETQARPPTKPLKPRVRAKPAGKLKD